MITAEELKELNYGPEMKAKLEELGVGDAWEDGKKKSKIISDALAKLAIIQSKKDAGASDEEAKDALEKVEGNQELLDKEKQEEADAAKANADALAKESEKIADLSKEQLEKNKERVLILIKTANIKQKEILSRKLVKLQEQIDELDA